MVPIDWTTSDEAGDVVTLLYAGENSKTLMKFSSLVFLFFVFFVGNLRAQFSDSWTVSNPSTEEAKVSIDILKDVAIVSATSKVFFFERVAASIVEKDPKVKTVQFYYGKAKSPLATYSVDESRNLKRTYHWVLDSTKEVVHVPKVWDSIGLGEPLPLNVEVVSRKSNGDNETAVLKEFAVVDLFKGKVARIIVIKKEMNYLAYQDLRMKLESEYGKPSDTSSFPKYASDNESRATSVSVGSGRVFLTWDFKTWDCTFKWSRSVAGISYEHKELCGRFDSTVATKP